MPNKVKATIGGVTLAGNTAITWKLTTGTTPYRTVMMVHKDDWRKLKSKLGQSVDIKVEPAHGKPINIRGVYILHEVASDSPHRVAFVVADRRWKFAYTMVSRDMNITKRSGDKNRFYDGNLPIENAITFDQFTFKWYSLRNGMWKWEAEEAVEHILHLLTDDGGNRFTIESFPVEREFTLQNVTLRDQGDVALARLLSFIPGAEIYVDIDGLVRLINASDYDETKRHWKQLPDPTYDGDKVVEIDRKAIRPSKAKVYFTRQIESLFEYADDWSKVTEGETGEEGGAGTGLYEDLDPNEPWLMNVIPTVDYLTTIIDRYEPPAEPGGAWTLVTTAVGKGTWIPSDTFVKSMNLEDMKPEGSLPWNWETIKRHWFKGDLEGVLAGAASRGVPDLDTNADWAARVQAFRQHFRQTYQINPRYMDRIRTFEATRVGPWDPISGAVAHAPVWGEICIIPSVKGQRTASRRDRERQGVWKNVLHIPEDYDGSKIDITSKTSGPGRIEIIDRDLGIFRVNWLRNPYGTVDSILPCTVVNDEGEHVVPTRALRDQKTKTVAPGAVTESGTNGIFLSDTMNLKTILSIVPAAPNNEGQFHEVELKPSDINERFQKELKIEGGDGPELQIFISPGESLCRLQWGTTNSNDEQSKKQVQDLLGLEFDDPTTNTPPIAEGKYNGLTFTNDKNEVAEVARAAAAEQFAAYADQIQGRHASSAPEKTGGGAGAGGKSPLVLRGNVSDVTLQIGAFPSGKVSHVSTFPGLPKPISRFALMPDSVRRFVLGIVPLSEPR